MKKYGNKQECKHKHCKVHTPVLSAFEPVKDVCAAGVVNLIERVSKWLLHRHRITAEQTHTHTHTHGFWGTPHTDVMISILYKLFFLSPTWIRSLTKNIQCFYISKNTWTTHTHTTHTHTHTHTNTHSHSHTHILSHTHSLTHTHHTTSHTLSHSHSHTHSHTPLTYTHTHTHTHTDTSHTHTHITHILSLSHTHTHHTHTHTHPHETPHPSLSHTTHHTHPHTHTPHSHTHPPHAPHTPHNTHPTLHTRHTLLSHTHTHTPHTLSLSHTHHTHEGRVSVIRVCGLITPALVVNESCSYLCISHVRCVWPLLQHTWGKQIRKSKCFVESSSAPVLQTPVCGSLCGVVQIFINSRSFSKTAHSHSRAFVSREQLCLSAVFRATHVQDTFMSKKSTSRL